MTRQEFLEALRETRTHLHWGLTTCGELRAWEPGNPDGAQYCPLTALAHLQAPEEDYADPGLWDGAALMLGADLIFASAVVQATDYGRDHDAALRRELLNACGLQEVA